jgi:MHS family proline/betaine transporter-like MFS transporter
MSLSEHHKKMTFIAAAGSTLETYEFVIFAMLAPYISQTFFAYDPHHVQAFATFAIGYIARPLGGVIFGAIGDIYGRRIAFTCSLIIIAFSTLGIALLPGYESIGWLAPCILVLLRGFQGISYGAELSGAMTLVREFSPKNRRGFYLCLLMIFVSLGSFLASGLIYILNHMPIPMGRYGWRIPFFIGSLGALFAFYVRRNLQESPEFLESAHQRKNRDAYIPLSQPLRTLLRDYKPQLLCTFGLNIFLTLIAIVYFYLPTYVITYGSHQSENVFGIICLAFLASILPALGGGILADKGYKLSTMVVVIGVFMALFIPIHTWILESSQTLSLFAGIALFELAYLMYWPSFSLYVADIFPVHVRYTAIASTYNLTYSFMSFIPMILADSFKNGFIPWMLPFIIFCISCLSLLTILYAWRRNFFLTSCQLQNEIT